ncbi:MAG TPA: hypothetical protein PLL45_00325 [Thermoflexales bacterium]|jgi:hypothetical protein|nr:hypothetical protein [Thermoflexales bacterium]
MNIEELYDALKRLIGKSLTFKRIAANSIILYFDGEPGDDTVRSIWLEPPWRYEVSGRVVIGSSDLWLHESDFSSKEEMDAEWTRRCRLTDTVNDSPLEVVLIDSVSNDVMLRFAGGKVMRNFSNSGLHDIAWTFRDRTQKLLVEVSSKQVEARTET